MPAWFRWSAGALIAVGLVAVPGIYYRLRYDHTVRFHVVSEGRFYRCGQVDAEGLRDIIRRNGIKTVVNLQHESPDPPLPENLLKSKVRTPESEVCKGEGADYRLLTFDPFPHALPEGQRPGVIEAYLAILDDPKAYPVLIHCKAGLHRTGELTAIYRMEYQGWSKGMAVREMKAAGFGDYACTSADDLVHNMVELYEPGRRAKTSPKSAPTEEPQR